MSHWTRAYPRLPGYPILFGLLCLSLIPRPVDAQTPRDNIQEFLATASGFTLRGNPEEGSLQEGRQMSFPVELNSGVDYIFVGFCDDDCGDLDMAVLDAGGEELEADYLPDAQPVLILTPERAGQFQIRVDMVVCSVEPCLFAVGVLEGELGEEGEIPGESMEERLNLFRRDFTMEGFAETPATEDGTLDEGQEIRFPISLSEGLEFKLVGVCDNDCENLDLLLFDPYGEEVTSDLLDDPIPLLTVIPAFTGEYRVAARMVTCTIEPCGFLVATFVAGEGVGPGGVLLTGPVVLEQTHQGTLEAGDGRLREGEFFDEYTVQAEAGQTILADLRSPDFDTYLILEAPGGTQERNDDWADDTMHSHIELVAEEAGTFSIIVTSFMVDETGEYTLQIAVVDGS